ncbi:hypothetical protein F8568_021800 [Actinomadura sp. LD22]|uniref:Uncharacterized protein n=1 Tax=Actinomadura physcomitrii TaxID=2650748 RepID=A0A6I4MBB7_9ACTN|nr:hypothetical protein [Actinomadura physcomitrii]MWA02963.1 hypothetical protein [Actinomadura physcomitrii]
MTARGHGRDPLHLAADGTVTAAHGPDADQFAQARLFHITADDAAGMLQTIQTANGSEPERARVPAGHRHAT